MIVRAAHFGFRRPNQVEEVPRLLQVHRHTAAHVGYQAEGADEQRRRDDNVTVAGMILVLQAVLAADERHAIGHGHVAARFGGAHQGAEHLRPVGVAPAKVVEQRDPRRVGADGDNVAHRLVDRVRGHLVRVEVAEPRVETAADGETGPGAENGRHHRRVAGAVVGNTNQWLDDAAALNLMVVLANDPFLAANVRRSEDLEQRVGEVLLAGLSTEY